MRSMKCPPIEKGIRGLAVVEFDATARKVDLAAFSRTP